MTRSTLLTRTVHNESRDNATVNASISAPKAQGSGEVFSSVMRMMMVPKGSCVQAGDTINDLGERYVVAYFNVTQTDDVFRMFHTPRRGVWNRRQSILDPVSKMQTTSGEVSLGSIWYNREEEGRTPDSTGATRNRYQLVTGAAMQINDTIDGMKVIQVHTDNGVFYVDAE